MLDDERRVRDAANAAAMRAKRSVDNSVWHIDRLRDGLRQLALAENPPPPELFEPAVLRSRPAAIDDHAMIIFPAGRVA
jgi:hypothetical protein